MANPPAAATSALLDTMYCQWFDSWEDKAAGNVSAEEFYDIAKDPYQLTNLVHKLPAGSLAMLRGNLTSLRTCKGAQACSDGASMPTIERGQLLLV